MDRPKHLLHSSLFVVAIYALSKITGFFKLVLTTQLFGAGPAADAFAAANQLPELFFALLSGGALGAALIPVYSARITAGESQAARQLANTVITVTLLILGSLAAIAMLFSPAITQQLLVPHFPAEQQHLTANLMRLVLAAIVIYSISSIFSSLLNAHHHFVSPAWASVVIDIGQIVGLYTLSDRYGIYAAGWGMLIGVIFHLGIQVPAILNYQLHFWPELALRLKSIHELARLMWPRIVTLGLVQAVDLVFIRLASDLPNGSISAYFYALLIIVFMPKSFFAGAIANVFFPTIAEQFNQGKRGELQETTTHALQAAWVLTIPAGVGFIALGKPAIAFLLERGAFDAQATALVYSLISILTIRLIAEATQDIFYLPFYAHHNTQTPMWANLCWGIINIGLSTLLVGPFGIHGLAWATTLATVCLVSGLYIMSRRKYGRFDERRLALTLARITGACFGMTLIIMVIRTLALQPLLYLITAISCGGVVYLTIYITLGGHEILTLWQLLKAKPMSK